MNSLFSSRLKRARAMACLSMDELALRVGVSKEAINKYEKSVAMPNSEHLIGLCNTLNVKPDYFFRPEVYQVGEFEFRKKSKLKGKKTEQIKERVKDQLERYLELEDLMSIGSEFINPVMKITISSIDEVENAADLVRKNWELGVNPISSVVEMLEDHNVKVMEADESNDFDGLSTMVNGKIPVIVVNKNFPIERKRFTLLHELAHLILKFNKSLLERDIEKYCHYFASAILIPRKAVYSEIGEYRNHLLLEELIMVQKEWGISVSALIYRLKDLGVISQALYQRYFMIYRSDKLFQAKVDEVRFPNTEISGRFMQLIYHAIAKEIISISKASALSNVSIKELNSSYSL